PVCRVPSIRSFIRFKSRSRVDLPHPLGPMRAVTDRSGTVRLTSKSACLPGYQKLTLRTANLAGASDRSADASPDDARVVKMSEYSRDTTRGLRSGPGERQGCCTAGL